MSIEQNIRDMAKTEGWSVNEQTILRISKAKERFFGEDNWKKCPCYPPDDVIHGCGTEACSSTIESDGVCHCNLYLRKK